MLNTSSGLCFGQGGKVFTVKSTLSDDACSSTPQIVALEFLILKYILKRFPYVFLFKILAPSS